MLDWIKSHLVDDWHNGWRWFSVQAQAVAVAFIGVWLYKPELVAEVCGPWASKLILLSLMILALGGRFILQGFSKKAE